LLIVDEPGSPAEELARFVHESSEATRDGEWVVVRCRGIPAQAIEAELFGHARGGKPGVLGGASEGRSGTVFIDGITDLGPNAQVRLLAWLGSGRDGPARGSWRVIAAASTDLAAAVRERRFRADLLDRLAVAALQIPPLRDRPADIERLALAFLRESAWSIGKRIESLSDEAAGKLRAHGFPGNERELRSAMERAAILETGPSLSAGSLDLGGVAAWGDDAFVSDVAARAFQERGRPATLAEVERAYIVWMLEHTHGNRTAAARLLGISYPTIAKKISDYRIDFQSLRGDPGRFSK
jgi:DNA-binding NtrC family response regulator